MVLGYKIELDLTNQAMRVIFEEGEATDIYESPNGLARCGISFEGRDTYVKWVEIYDPRKATLVMDWVSMAVAQALGDDDDYWQSGFEIVPIVRQLHTDSD